ncbi:hypothetical protein JCM33374_g2580 [Metschnikowia sp. JCM 33374]|nr:hypothetical protein JCM33374_g2580 [Metschnikowia sp. JCM 33374]
MVETKGHQIGKCVDQSAEKAHPANINNARPPPTPMVANTFLSDFNIHFVITNTMPNKITLEAYNITEPEFAQLLKGVKSFSHPVNITLESPQNNGSYVLSPGRNDNLLSSGSSRSVLDEAILFLLVLMVTLLWNTKWPRFITDDKRFEEYTRIDLEFHSEKRKVAKTSGEKLSMVPDLVLMKFISDFGINVATSPGDPNWKRVCVDAITSTVIRVLDRNLNLQKKDGTPFRFYGHENRELSSGLLSIRQGLYWPWYHKNKSRKELESRLDDEGFLSNNWRRLTLPKTTMEGITLLGFLICSIPVAYSGIQEIYSRF